MPDETILSEHMTPLLERARILHEEVGKLVREGDNVGVIAKDQEYQKAEDCIGEFLIGHIDALLCEMSEGWPYVVSNAFTVAYGPPPSDGDPHLLALNFAGIVYSSTCKPTTTYHAMYFFQAFASTMNAYFKKEEVPVYIFVGIDDTIEDTEA